MANGEKTHEQLKDSLSYGVEVAKQLITIGSAGVIFLTGLVFSKDLTNQDWKFLLSEICFALSILFGIIFLMNVAGNINKIGQYEIYTAKLRSLAFLQILSFLFAIGSASFYIFTFKNNSSQKSKHKTIRLEEPPTKTISNINRKFTLLFDLNSSKISPGNYIQLYRINQILNTDDAIMLIVEGHTDSSGSENYNMILSEKRAEAVKKILEQMDVRKDRIKTEYFGESQLLTSNHAHNRRVDVLLRGGNDSSDKQPHP